VQESNDQAEVVLTCSEKWSTARHQQPLICKCGMPPGQVSGIFFCRRLVVSFRTAAIPALMPREWCGTTLTCLLLCFVPHRL
jgi:hypothetical protein